MDLHPFYDIINSEWVAEVNGEEVCAGSLAELQTKLPQATIRDYCPEGYVAHWEGFLAPSTRPPRVVSYKSPTHKAGGIGEVFARKEAKATPEAAAPVPKPKPTLTYDVVMDRSEERRVGKECRP